MRKLTKKQQQSSKSKKSKKHQSKQKSSHIQNLMGPSGHVYAEFIPDSKALTYTGFNDSFTYMTSPYYKMHIHDTLPVPYPRKGASLVLSLKDFVGEEMIHEIEKSGQISFHSVGDTGLANMRKGIDRQEGIADVMVREVETGGENAPAFLYHLGDIVYYFGESQYYFEQFYDPYRHYNRPIFAIPGNHDGQASMPPSATLGRKTPLEPFLHNFCSSKPHRSLDGGGVARTTMTQPGVYFTLDAPFVSIIGLYTNCRETGGIISTQNGEYPNVTDQQLAFLTKELKRLAPERNAGKRAIILATHAPLYDSTGVYGSQGIVDDVFACCEEANIFPDVLLAAHVHAYERQTLTLPNGQQVPCIIAGTGGFGLQIPPYTPAPVGTTIDGVTVEVPFVRRYGFLTITTDAQTLTVSFRTPVLGGREELDTVTLDLQTRLITEGTVLSS